MKLLRLLSLLLVLVCLISINIFSVYAQTELEYHTPMMIDNKFAWSGVGNTLRNTAITPFINTSTEGDIYLSFTHRYDVLGEDVAQVYINIFGWAWSKVAEFTGTDEDWTIDTVRLPNWSYGEAIRIKFVYITFEDSNGEGWSVDDIYLKQRTIEGEDVLLFTQDFESFVIGEKWGHWTISQDEIIDNEPPHAPSIFGPVQGKPDNEYEYFISSIDPNNDDVFFTINWGDNHSEQWIGPVLSNNEIVINHTWLEGGDYVVQVQAKDIYGLLSETSTLQISIPKQRESYVSIFISILKDMIYSRFNFLY